MTEVKDIRSWDEDFIIWTWREVIPPILIYIYKWSYLPDVDQIC